MGKNLKRQNDGVFGTPGGVSRQGGKPPMSIGGKRHKQMSLVPFLRTPAHVEETPALQPKSGKADISSTGLQKLGQLNIRTHQKLQQSASTVAPTQGRPTIPVEPVWQECSPASNDDFVISMSQTYERTQPDPCSDYALADRDDVELSLRRTQHYQAPEPTHHYSQHHHDLLLMTAAAAALDSAALPAFATTTATEAWEASVAEASALPGDTSTADVLLPLEHALEGQGSNQLGNLFGLVAAAAAATAAANRHTVAPAVPQPFGDLTCRTRPAAPTASGGSAQTPDLQMGGSVAWGGTGAGGNTCTVTTDDVADDGTTPPLQVGVPLFPIFTQAARVRRRPIHLIRHGESEYNLACRRRGGFGDPSDIFDARLTQHGEKQARSLRPQMLELMQRDGDPLFIVSPLSRAIETFLLMLPDPERLRVIPKTPPQHADAGPAYQPSRLSQQQQNPEGKEQRPPGGGAARNGATCGASLVTKPLNVVICPFLSEFLHTSGDVGRPRSVLIEDYPQLAEPIRQGLDKERWWYENTSRGPNCAIDKTLSCTEPEKVSKARVDRFRQYVFSQPHRPIVVVGHANFFRTLTHDSHYMANCQVTSWTP